MLLEVDALFDLCAFRAWRLRELRCLYLFGHPTSLHLKRYSQSSLDVLPGPCRGRIGTALHFISSFLTSEPLVLLAEAFIGTLKVFVDSLVAKHSLRDLPSESTTLQNDRSEVFCFELEFIS